MDAFVSTHTSGGVTRGAGREHHGVLQKKADIPFYYDLAKKFTICDHYHCSVLGPTHPNRVMAISGSIDPAGVAGGPILVTESEQIPYQWTCTWPTMPEVLQDAGISWKACNPHGSNYQPGAPYFFSKNVLLYFGAYQDPTSPLYQQAFNFSGTNVSGGLTDGASPDDFAADVQSGNLPQVSWIMTPDAYDEHPRLRPPSGSGTPNRSSTPCSPTPRCGPRRSCSSCTTRTTGSSTTCRRRRRPPARPAST